MRTIDSLTAVKDVVIGADGTFKFEGCDFGFVHSDLLAKMARGEMHTVVNVQPLVRGSGKWRPAANGEDESLTLRLEYAAGNGTQTTTAPWYQGAKVETWTISPDGKTLNSTASQGPAPSRSRPVQWFATEWILKPAAEEPASGNGCAASDECRDEKPLQDKRPVVACANAPGVGKVKATKKKKEADVMVFILGPAEWHEPPGSSGTFKVRVGNAGPCDTSCSLDIDLCIASGGSPDWPVGGSVSITSLGPKESGKSDLGPGVANLNYDLWLPKGTFQVVQVKGHDTTTPNQKYPYVVGINAAILGKLPDPDESNNHSFRSIHVDLPPGSTTGSATGPRK